MPPGAIEPNKSLKMAMIGGIIGGALGSIIVQLICCWLCHSHQVPGVQ
ncbi:MAG TPA: hypothetical protein VHL14_02305 [Steroidobacteraceae bacterium]|nr:hypothetical protein [Steroidobacteraceae bacterium]